MLNPLERWLKNGSFGFCVGFVRWQNQMCHLCVGLKVFLVRWQKNKNTFYSLSFCLSFYSGLPLTGRRYEMLGDSELLTYIPRHQTLMQVRTFK